MSINQEIEAKFRVDDPQLFAVLLQTAQLGLYTLTPLPEPEQQHNTYFDTPDGRLGAQRYGLRIRDLGQRRIATLKGPNSVQHGVHTRAEWEADIGANDAPADWPAGELRERTLALLEGSAVVPILTIRTLRRHVLASRAGVLVAELSLDEGEMLAGTRTQPFRELEVERLPSGTLADFEALVDALRTRFALLPESRSKLERGLAYAKGGDDADTP